MKKNYTKWLVLGGVAAVTAVIIIAAKGARAAEECILLETPMRYYYFTYTGGSKTVRAALGECYPVIFTLDVYDEETDDWVPPADPEHDLLRPGCWCRVMVQAPCTLCGFTPR